MLDFFNVVLHLHTLHALRVFPLSPFLAALCASWRRFLLATPSFLATRMLGDACRHFEREKDKD